LREREEEKKRKRCRREDTRRKNTAVKKIVCYERNKMCTKKRSLLERERISILCCERKI